MLAQLFHLVTREIIVIDPGPEPERRVGFDSATAIAVFGSVAAVQDVVREADVQSEELIRLKSILLSPPVQSPATSQEVSESNGNNDSNQMS